MAHSQPVTVDSLRGLRVFAPLPAPALDQLLRAGSVRRFSVRQRLSEVVQGPSENYWFVLDGMVAIALEGEANRAPGGATRRAEAGESELEYLGCFGPGACFSDGFLATDPGSPLPRIDCLAAAPSTLLEVGRLPLSALMTSHTEWSRELARQLAASRAHFLTQQEPGRRVVQDFYLRHGFATGSRVRVGQLDRCLDCDKCQQACAARHGAPRVVRSGPRLGRVVFSVACRTCIDRPCLAACGFGALCFDEVAGDVRINERCKGCGACSVKCPNGAIFMVQGPYTLADFPDPIPATDPRGMTNVSALFVAGDVSGAALIRLAMNEAVRAIDSIGPRRSPPDPRMLDVAIIGAGPAGLAAALRCQERNLSYLVLEKDQLGATIQDYPKNKHVMAEPSAVPLMSSLWFEECTKEELLARWRQTAVERRIQILEHSEVRSIDSQNGMFVLESEQGSVAAEHVLVCMGKRGSPRKLGVAGETHPRVRYVLTDPDELAGQNVLIVGGGDSAVEAALSLAEIPGTRVTLSYRQAAFTRTKAINRERLLEEQAAGRVRVELKSTVKALEPRRVRLNTERGEQLIDNDVVLALLGADPPTGFLQGAGIRVLQPGSPEMAEYAVGRGQRQRAVKCDRCAGYADRACLSACPMGGLMEVEPDQIFLDGVDPNSGAPRFSDVPFVEGIERWSLGTKQSRWAGWVVTGATLLVLLGIGLEAFFRTALPEWSLAARYLELTGQSWTISYGSGRGFGHWLGYIGTSLMLLTLLYSVRTRISRCKGWGAQTTWLSAHLWVGFAGAALVTYHSALKLNRWASIACFLMWLVILTGALGRYVYGKIHSGISLAEFELMGLRRQRLASARYRDRSAAVRILLGREPGEVEGRVGIFGMLWLELRDRVLLLWLRTFGLGLISDRKARRDLIVSLSGLAASRRDRAGLESAKTMMAHWNIVHIVLAILMFLLAGVHVVYGFLYKAV